MTEPANGDVECPLDGETPDAALLTEPKAEARTIENTESSPHAWMILVLVFLGVTTVYGMTTCVGVFHVVFLEEFREKSAVTSWIGALNTGFSMLSGTVCSVLTRRFPCRTLIMSGLLICSVGLFTSAFARSVLFLYLSYGVLTGLGVGFTYMGLCCCMAQTFQRRLPLASGITTSAIGLSMVVFPSLVQTWTDQYGWRDTYLILAAMIIQFCVAACFIKPIVKPRLASIDLGDVLRLSLLREIRFVLFLASTCVMNMGASVVFVHLIAYVYSRGFEEIGRWLFPLFGLTNCIGRFGFGALGSLPRVDPAQTMLVSNALAGLALLLLPSCPGPVTIMICVAAFGLLNGANGYTSFALPQRYFGQEQISTCYGYILLACAVAFLSGAPLAGFVYDSTQNYGLSMYLGGGVTCLSSIVQIAEAFGPLRPHKLPRIALPSDDPDKLSIVLPSDDDQTVQQDTTT